jgi:hypothetical protein
VLQDARAFGMSEADIAALRTKLSEPAARVEAGDGIWPENAAIVAAFLAASSQWNLVSIGGGMAPGRLLFVGLNYPGAIAGIEAAGVVITPELWAGVRIMEAEAREAMNGSIG